MSLGIQPLTIIVFSGSYLIRLGMEKIFETEKDTKVISQCSVGARLWNGLAVEKPHVAIIDMETESDVLLLIQSIKERHPYIKIVLLSGFEDRERTRKVFDHGVDGIILKVQPPAVVLAIVQNLVYQSLTRHTEESGTAGTADDERANIPKRLDGAPNQWPGALTEREREVIALVGQGLSNKDIANRLCISAITVRHHLTSIFDKVGVPNRQKLLIHTHCLRASSP
jgi:DNA-binding NarL/FixJ family response regulator